VRVAPVGDHTGGMDAVMERTQSVAAVATEHREETEQGRRLARPVVDALVAPTALGGGAADPTTFVRTVLTLAVADASVGWCYGIGAGSNFLSALIPRSAAAEVFADVTLGGAGPFAPSGRADVVDGGYRVSGRWPYSSNCHQAAVISAGMIAFADGRPAEMTPEGGPLIRLGFFTADQLEIEETWDTVGMRGTGSHDMVGNDIPLPAERASHLFAPMWPDDPLFRLRSFDVLGACLSPVPLGIGRAALDVVAAKAVADESGPPSTGPRARLGDDPVAQVALGRAETRLRAAEAWLIDALGVSYDHACAGDTPPRAATAAIGLANCEALEAGKYAVATAIRLLGSASVRDGAPLDRLRRDVDTAGSHIMFSPTVVAGLSRELAGIPTVAFPYLPPE
jgi:alkylation response protein AidB-like acyl-CoA dehydrogenase